MTTFHQQIAGRIERHMKDRRMVVLYDPRGEFEPFVSELRARAGSDDAVELGGSQAWLREYDGSFLALRREVEHALEASGPRCGLLYVPGQERDRQRSALMECDLAGHTYEPQLRKLARDILRERRTDGEIDTLLAPEGVGYSEIAAFFDGGSSDVSLLRSLFGSIGSEAILSQWILDASRDEEIASKGAGPELRSLIESRVGLPVNEAAELPAARRDLLRYLLINEFRMDLGGTSPSALDMIPTPGHKDERDRIRLVCADLRSTDAAQYEVLADEVEGALGLTNLDLPAETLGAIDTFRFEEQRLLEEAARRLAASDHDEALSLATGRAGSHWVRNNPRRLAQWSALEQAAVLGQRVAACRQELSGFGVKAPPAWIERYTADEGWSAVDALDRRLGAFLSAMDEEPVAAQAISQVRAAYSEWVRLLGEGFVSALTKAEWDPAWDLHQTQVFDDRVKPAQEAVAFFVVDAFRYEMAVELAERLVHADRVTLEPAVAALPTITSVGMAALLPGASESYSVQAGPKGIAGAIEGTLLPDWPARWKHLQAKVPGSVEIRLEKLLHTSANALAEQVEDARLVLVRSQDIDAVGEAGVGLVAQQAMATVIPNLARAVHRLSKAGVRRFVVSADHGHLLDETQAQDMKIDTPGGEKVELHRRCWAGRGGKTPTGAVRVSGANLGYDTDLDFVFPSGRGVFLAGGGLQYHHGGLSLQELIVPVLSLTVASSPDTPGPEAKVRLHELPDAITNRTVGIQVELAPDLFAEPHWVRVVLLDQSEQVGEAGMVQGAVMDSRTKRIQLTPGQPATVGLMLGRDDCKTVKLVVLDAESDAVMAQSKNLKVSLTI